MATPALIPTDASRDTTGCLCRVTREGRRLWYQLTVLQQPERARACGAGQKAHNDRRPVDPPPVVELRIFEGESVDVGKDVTFDYNAQFFLFASLEKSRPIIHGRVHTPATASPPILNGTCCSGMAYLDRPVSAGYFIFPDLSVRHEGFYHLNFNLYEMTKEPKDMDADVADADLPPGSDFRMEIKTEPFEVYSAKKFPGLTESTNLSKTVADQGCRVRIRREVRMRKRTTKGSGHSERREEEIAARPRHSHRTVDDPSVPLRARSQSNTSDVRQACGPEAPRKPSIAEPYHAAPAYDHVPGPQPTAHMSYAPEPHFAAPRPPTSHHIHPPLPPSPGGPYSHTSSYQSFDPVRRRPSQSSVAPMIADPDRRSSAQTVPSSPAYHSSIDHFRRDSVASHPVTPTTASPATMFPSSVIRPSERAGDAPMKISALVSPVIEPQTEPDPPAPDTRTGGKRKHQETFVQNSTPLHNGSRPADMNLMNRPKFSMEPGQATWVNREGHYISYKFNNFVGHKSWAHYPPS